MVLLICHNISIAQSRKMFKIVQIQLAVMRTLCIYDCYLCTCGIRCGLSYYCRELLLLKSARFNLYENAAKFKSIHH